jgi:hypothetical protein
VVARLGFKLRICAFSLSLQQPQPSRPALPFWSLEGVFNLHNFSSYFQIFVLFLLRYNRFITIIYSPWPIFLILKSVS